MKNKSPIILEKTNSLDILKLNNLSHVRVDHLKEEVQLVDSNNTVHLVITFTENGLELTINAKNLKINVSEQLSLSGEEINIHASKKLSLISDGNLISEIDGSMVTHVRGDNENIARIQKVTSTLGNIEMKANDNFKVEGERVLLNCD
ncbi:MAG: hypothetical protein V9G42_04625 [Bacteroidia bacterium]